MKKRREEILKLITEEYIKTAQPIGSDYLFNKFKIKVSPATIRNEMIALAKKDYIYQPYTSAGRVPTIKGFKYYVEKLIFSKTGEEIAIPKLSKKELNILANIIKQDVLNQALMKTIIRKMALMSNELSFLSIDNDFFFYTGLSHLFNQPEFYESNAVCDISNIIDHLDKIVINISDSMEQETEIFIGRKNLLDDFCSAVLTNFSSTNSNKQILIGILGPTRMDYGKNIALINEVKGMFFNI
ncbi:hypothetical protein ISS06_02195 [Patescibacteria group bacterium]|nr:hypothetical protein [Patescibacteria group bacterium]